MTIWGSRRVQVWRPSYLYLPWVPNAAPISVVASGEYGYLVCAQNGFSVQRRVGEIMPGDNVWSDRRIIKMWEALLGIWEFESKKSKIRVFHASLYIRQQMCAFFLFFVESLFLAPRTDCLKDCWDLFLQIVESVSYRWKIWRVIQWRWSRFLHSIICS